MACSSAACRWDRKWHWGSWDHSTAAASSGRTALPTKCGPSKLRALECRRARGSRFEPILVIIQNESGHQKDPPQNVCSGRWSSVIVVHSRNETKGGAYHDKEGDLPVEGSRSEITLHLLWSGLTRIWRNALLSSMTRPSIFSSLLMWDRNHRRAATLTSVDGSSIFSVIVVAMFTPLTVGFFDTTNFVISDHFEPLCGNPLISAHKYADLVSGEHWARCDLCLKILHCGCSDLFSFLRDLAFFDIANHLAQELPGPVGQFMDGDPAHWQGHLWLRWILPTMIDQPWAKMAQDTSDLMPFWLRVNTLHSAADQL